MMQGRPWLECWFAFAFVMAACGDSDSGSGDAGSQGGLGGTSGAGMSAAGGRSGANAGGAGANAGSSGRGAGSGGNAGGAGKAGSAPDAGVNMSTSATLVEIPSTGALTCELGCASLGRTCAPACMGQEISIGGLPASNVAGVAWYHERAGAMVIEVPANIPACDDDVDIAMRGLRTSLECCCKGDATSRDGGPAGEPVDCSGQSTCTGCQDCARDTGGACFDAHFACEADARCAAFRSCARNCSDSACLDNCTLGAGEGFFLFSMLTDCLCDACATQCGGPGGCEISF